MVAIALLCAVTCYAGAMVLAATPLARPIGPPVGRVVAALGAGVLAHGIGVILLAHATRVLPIAGLGPALSFAGLALATALLLTEMLAQDVTLALVGAPLAAFATGAAIFVGLDPRHPAQPHGLQGLWLASHIALSFVGIAALATAGTAGTLYLVERRELKERRFGRVFRLFPPLETLDRVNHLASVIGWLGLTVGMLLAASYAVAYGLVDGPRIVWGLVAWCAASVVAMGRLLGGWRARRAAIAAAVAWALVIVTYVAARALAGRPGQFL
jgi:HemX protein